VVEELPSHDRAYGVAAMVAFVGVAGTVTEEPCQRIGSTRFEFRSENVQWHFWLLRSIIALYVVLRM